MPTLSQVFEKFLPNGNFQDFNNIQQAKAVAAIKRCRTKQLGGHILQCSHCQKKHFIYHSCRNRHCPQCQNTAKLKWAMQRHQELLPIPYFHVVFTLPHELNIFAKHHPRLCYNLLFKTASATLLQFSKNDKKLKGELGIIMLLHTWSQDLSMHIHVHCLVTAGAFNIHKNEWNHRTPGFLVPVKALSRVFRAKYLEAWNKNIPNAYPTIKKLLFQKDWVVYVKPCVKNTKHIIDYLARYTHKTAISNDRIITISNSHITFTARDNNKPKKRKNVTLTGKEFVTRYLNHILPQKFMRIRYYGLYGNRGKKAKLTKCRILLGAPTPEPQPVSSTAEFIKLFMGIDIEKCPTCQLGDLKCIEVISPLPWRSQQANAPNNTVNG